MPPLAFAVFNVVLAAAAVWDVRTLRIPNALPLTLALAGALLALPSLPDDGLLRLASLVLVGGVGLGLYLSRMIGGGDLKLLAAAALWIPLPSLPLFAVLLGLAGGVQGAATLAAALALRGSSPTVGRRRRQMPYAVAIASAGFVWSLLSAGS